METDKSSPLTDIQKQRDHRELRIDKVGVRDLRFPIRIRDKAHAHQDTIATIGMFVDLPHHFKGTHMSRFIEVLNAHGNVVHVENIPDILRAMQKRLDSQTAHLEMDFPFFLEKSAPVTGQTGLMDYQARFDATANGDEIDFVLEVRTNVTTLCPCSKAISAEGAHNQRGLVTVQLRSEETVWIEDVITLVEQSASCELYSLLKRPDEKYVTEAAYANPVFVEDLVRNVATHLNALPHVTWYKVEAENFESIHNHNAYACIEKG
jgi:GTP cyclohydrolase I